MLAHNITPICPHNIMCIHNIIVVVVVRYVILVRYDGARRLYITTLDS